MMQTPPEGPVSFWPVFAFVDMSFDMRFLAFVLIVVLVVLHFVSPHFQLRISGMS